MQWTSSLNKQQAKLKKTHHDKDMPHHTKTDVIDIKSSFELVTPSSVQEVFLKMTSLKGRCFGEKKRS